jgi:putative ABC transport system permease protein
VREIVGVVADIREEAAERDGRPQAYVPLAQAPWYGGTLYVRPSEGSAAALAPAVRAAVARVDKERPVSHLQTLAELGATATSRWRFRALLVATFAGLALLLAVIGVFGVLTYTVEQRTREFGVRIALGATAGSVLRIVFAGAGRMVITGAVVGLALAAASARTITTFLFGVEPLDPVAFAAAALVLMVTAAIAVASPALRAARVDPVVAFRTE